MNVDTLSMRGAVQALRNASISSNGDSNAPCTVGELNNLKEAIARTLDEIIFLLDN